MNRKGFTLIELIATILLLGLVISIGTYSVIQIINTSREKSYNSLIENIKVAVLNYAIECRYDRTDEVTCSTQFTLGDLVKYGYLSGNGKNNQKEFILVDPRDNSSISDCIISYTYDDGVLDISAVNASGSCPTSY